VGDQGDVGCVGICGGLMRCGLCRYMRRVCLSKRYFLQRCVYCSGVN